MKNTSGKKLQLNRLTVRTLSTSDLRKAAGASGFNCVTGETEYTCHTGGACITAGAGCPTKPKPI